VDFNDLWNAVREAAGAINLKDMYKNGFANFMADISGGACDPFFYC
jgi:hypothetical protein